MERPRGAAQGGRKGGSLLPTSIWGKSGKDLKLYCTELGIQEEIRQSITTHYLWAMRVEAFLFNYIFEFFYNNIPHLNNLKICFLKN